MVGLGLFADIGSLAGVLTLLAGTVSLARVLMVGVPLSCGWLELVSWWGRYGWPLGSIIVGCRLVGYLPTVGHRMGYSG